MKEASHFAFVFDANRCTGCAACQVACTIENGLAPDFSWRRIETFNLRHHPAAPVFHLSLACHHCADAACMRACPALAYARDAATGAVLLEPDRCIGCRYCAWACPYDAPVFDAPRGVMTKCTWCVERLRRGLAPACATHCPTGALDYAAVPPHERAQAIEGFPVTRLDPSLRVIPLKPGRTQPEMTAGVQLPASGFQLPADLAPGAHPSTRSGWPERVESQPPAAIPRLARDGLSVSKATAGISLRHEWPLAAFTLLAATLVAAIAAAAAGRIGIDAWHFALAAAVSMALGGSHLGRRDRAWRASLNLRGSWLSREIVALSLFFALSTVWLLVLPDSRALGWSSALVGFIGLVAADRLYGVLPAGPGYRHSAGAAWMGLFLGAVFARDRRLAALIGLVKAGLYVGRKWRFASEGRPIREALTVVRVGLGFVASFAVWAIDDPGLGAAVAALALAGEAIDRGEYYVELERESPRRQMDRALARYTDRPWRQTPNVTGSPA